MTEVSGLLFDLFVIFLAAKTGGALASLVRQPPVLGELLAGVLIGPYALGLIGAPGPELVAVFGNPETASQTLKVAYHLIAELGVIVLLFFVGLETRLEEVTQVGARAVAVGILGIVFPFVFGVVLMGAMGWSGFVPLFTATALVATSVGITARVLQDLGAVRTAEARIILGAAVVDDILALILLAVVAGLAAGRDLSPLAVVLLVGQAVGFTVFVALVGRGMMRRYALHLERLPVPDAPFSLAVVLMLGLAALAGAVGLAAIVGAFLAGMVLAEAREQYELERRIEPLYTFLAPFFFVLTGSQVDWRVFLQPELAVLAGLVTGLAVLGKLLGGGLAALGLAPRQVLAIGIGMVPRGEVGLIVAGLGQSLGIIPPPIFAVVVAMSFLTTLIVPPALALLYRRTLSGKDFPT